MSTTSSVETMCPSRGLSAPRKAGLPAAPSFPASPECWEEFGRLSAYGLEQASEDFRHQVAIDAYAAQHPGPPARRITLWFALAGLHLALDKGWTGRQVQVAHQRLSHLDKVGPDLDRPSYPAAMTVGDVMAECPGYDRDTAVLAWARAVWRAWGPDQARVAARLPPLNRLL